MDKGIEWSFQRDVESLQLIKAFSDRDDSQRTEAALTLKKHFYSLFTGFGSPCGETSYLDPVCGASNGGDISLRDQIHWYLPDLLRLSLTCPLEDVRQHAEDLLSIVNEKFDIRLPRMRPACQETSRFIKSSLLVPLFVDECEDYIVDAQVDFGKTQSLFLEHFHEWNRVDNVIRVMGYHPDYLDRFMRLHNHLLLGNGPLPRPLRHYLAIMAASRHQCSYLVHIHATQFLLEDGDPLWLKGLEHTPKKLRELSVINRLLAHKPWLLCSKDIDMLNTSFSLNELGHALALLCHFHALSSFVHACGINPEMDSAECFTYRHASSESTSMSAVSAGSCSGGRATPLSNGHATGAVADNDFVGTGSPNVQDSDSLVKELLEKMRQMGEDVLLDPEEVVRRYQKVELQNVEITVSQERPTAVTEELYRFVDDPHFCYVDFMTNKNTPTFRMQKLEERSPLGTNIASTEEQLISEFCALSTADYPWEDAASLANMLYCSLGELIDDKISTTYDLTYRTCGNNEDVDTSVFRRSIWNYIHVLFGIFHDDYNYTDVNHLLNRPLKTYVKTVACYPERVTKKDYDSFMQGFKHSEKVHVNLMILEARLQAELLYVLRAVQRRNSLS